MRRWTVGIALALGPVLSLDATAKDWPHWGGDGGRNMVADEKCLPETFVPGQKDPQGGGIDPATTKSVKWAVRLGSMSCSTPAVVGGRVFVGTADEGEGKILCLDAGTGKLLWRWSAKPREVPKTIDGHKFWFDHFPRTLGVTSSPAVDEDRVYFSTHRCEVLCLDVRGDVKAPLVLWSFDMFDFGVRPSDACNCSVLVHGDFVYVGTSNGVDRDADASKHGELCKPYAPSAPNLIVLEKRTGRLVAVDDAPIVYRLLHGQWSSPSLGRVGDKTLVFYGGGDGVSYAFEALSTVPQQPVKLKTVWSCDLNPPEYKVFGDMDLITHYSLGDRRRTDTINKVNDGSFVGMSEVIATPVFCNNRVYLPIGRDPEHGRGRGAMWCIDATKTGDITQSGKVWCYQGLDRSLSTVSIADGLA